MLAKIKSGGWVIIILAVVWVMTNVRLKTWETTQGIINSDVISYYAYLPAVFIYQDVSLKFKKDPSFQFNDKLWAHPLPGNHFVIKMSMGLSLMYLPFFLAAHTYCQVAGLPANGFSDPYEIALLLSSLFYSLIGFNFLRRLLLRYFTEGVTALCLIIIGLGTNLFNYVTLEACMSHAYLFCLITIFAWYVSQWYSFPSPGNTMILGITFGLITLIRPTNILVILVFVFYEINSFKSLITRIQWWWKMKWKLLTMVLLFLLIWAPQLAYWKYNTGQWLFFSYVGEGFHFGHPHLFDGFFSYRKGWLLYTPVMVISLLGFFTMRKKIPEFFTGILTYFMFSSYLILSWWCWWYGGSFGMRPFIDLYGLLALPMGSLITVVFHKALWKRMALVLVMAGAIVFQLFQSRQYYYGSIHWDSMSKEAYWASFLKKYPPPGWHYLLQAPDYEAAKETGVENKNQEKR